MFSNPETSAQATRAADVCPTDRLLCIALQENRLPSFGFRNHANRIYEQEDNNIE